jgi:hypothetical protein
MFTFISIYGTPPCCYVLVCFVHNKNKQALIIAVSYEINYRVLTQTIKLVEMEEIELLFCAVGSPDSMNIERMVRKFLFPLILFL